MTLSAWEQARREARAAFYEAATDTVRVCPQNYCLAHRRQPTEEHAGEWRVFWDGAIAPIKDQIEAVLADNRHATGEHVARLLEPIVRSWRAGA